MKKSLILIAIGFLLTLSSSQTLFKDSYIVHANSGFILNPSRWESSDLVFTINTALGTAASFDIPMQSTYSYNYVVNWGDGDESTITSYDDIDKSHTYSGDAIYQLTISGTFEKFYFNNAGDILKLTSIDQWGAVSYSTNQELAFYGCTNLTSIADNIDWINDVTNGSNMFFGCSITSLPSGMTLGSLADGSGMFRESSLTSIPSGMLLNNLTDGTGMFYQCSLTSLPSLMTLSVLEFGGNMFLQNSLTSLPSGMTLGSLTDGSGMFRQNSLTSLPSGMTLDVLDNGALMFLGCSITSLPSSVTLDVLDNGALMFSGNTISTSDYSVLLVNIETNNSNTEVTFHGGNSKYNTAGETARNALLARSPAWIITDGGLE